MASNRDTDTIMNNNNGNNLNHNHNDGMNIMKETSNTNHNNNEEYMINKPIKENNLMHIQAIERMINEIKEITKKKRIYKTNKEYFPCHSCKELFEKHYLLHCTEKECSRYFCSRCVSIRFGKTPQQILEIMKLMKWSCFSCTEECNCRICKTKIAESASKMSENKAQNDINNTREKKLTSKSDAITKPLNNTIKNTIITTLASTANTTLTITNTSHINGISNTNNSTNMSSVSMDIANIEKSLSTPKENKTKNSGDSIIMDRNMDNGNVNGDSTPPDNINNARANGEENNSINPNSSISPNASIIPITVNTNVISITPNANAYGFINDGGNDNGRSNGNNGSLSGNGSSNIGGNGGNNANAGGDSCSGNGNGSDGISANLMSGGGDVSGSGNGNGGANGDENNTSDKSNSNGDNNNDNGSSSSSNNINSYPNSRNSNSNSINNISSNDISNNNNNKISITNNNQNALQLTNKSSNEGLNSNPNPKTLIKPLIIEERKMIIEEKLPPRKAKIIGKQLLQIKRGLCHYCNEEINVLESMSCSKRNCKNIYCPKCILLNFDKNFEFAIAIKNPWICYSCNHLCKCKKCYKSKKNLTGIKIKIKNRMLEDHQINLSKL